MKRSKEFLYAHGVSIGNSLVELALELMLLKTSKIYSKRLRLLVEDLLLLPVAPPTAEQRLDRKNELKARGNLLMALPDKHQLKFNIHKDAKTLMEATEKRESLSQEDINLKFLRSLPKGWRTHTLIWMNKTDLEDRSLVDMFNSLKIYEAEIKSSSFASTSTQNIAFVSSQNTNITNKSVSVVANVSAGSAKAPVSALPNVDTLSDVVIYSFFASQSNSPQLDNDDLKKIDADDLEEMDLKWQMAIYDWSLQAEEEPTNYALMAFTSSSSSSSDNKEDIKLLKLDVQLRDNALVVLRQKFKKAEQERDELKLKLEKYQSGEGYQAVPPPYIGTFIPPKPDLVFHDALTVNETVHAAFNVELSPTMSDKDLSQTRRPSAPIIEDWVSDLEYDSEAVPSQNDPRKTFSSLKAIETTKLERHVVPTAVLTRSKLVPLTTARQVNAVVPHNNAIRPRPAKITPKVNVVKGVQGNWVWKPKCPILDHVSCNTSASMTLKRFDYNDALRNPKGGKITGKGKIRTGKLDFDDVYFVKELKFNLFSVSHMCDKKNSVLFIDTECIVLSLEFKLPDENQVLLRVLRENNMYNVDLKNIVPSRDLTFIFVKATLDESNLWHRRLGHINFKTMNKLVIGKFDGKVDEGFFVGYSVSSKAFRVFNSRTRIVQETLHINFLENKPNVIRSGPTWLFDIDTLTKSMNYQSVTARNQSNPSACIQKQFDAEKAGEGGNVQQYVIFPLWSCGSKDPQNTDDDATFEVKEPEFVVEKPESEVHVSPSSSATTKKHDDKTKRKAKGKSHVESLTRFRNLSEEFEDFTYNSINEVSAASTPIPVVGQISTNNTNPFSDVGPSNTAVSPTHKKSSYVDSFQYPDDPNMPALEEITYSDDEENVGAEADFTNLETTITVGLLQQLKFIKIIM
nr:ribonuclease H-like domain-containing protein [Tanacetum cinerariifolium]